MIWARPGSVAAKLMGERPTPQRNRVLGFAVTHPERLAFDKPEQRKSSAVGGLRFSPRSFGKVENRPDQALPA